jgi:hypothetical protein
MNSVCNSRPCSGFQKTFTERREPFGTPCVVSASSGFGARKPVAVNADLRVARHVWPIALQIGWTRYAELCPNRAAVRSRSPIVRGRLEPVGLRVRLRRKSSARLDAQQQMSASSREHIIGKVEIGAVSHDQAHTLELAVDPPRRRAPYQRARVLAGARAGAFSRRNPVGECFPQPRDAPQERGARSPLESL